MDTRFNEVAENYIRSVKQAGYYRVFKEVEKLTASFPMVSINTSEGVDEVGSVANFSII